MEVPNHIAIIPDGNRRWAKEHNFPTIEGHRRGFDNLIPLAKKSRELGITTMTIWAFSTENWQRATDEVNYLMKLYGMLIDKHLQEAITDQVRIVHVGRKDRIPKSLMSQIEKTEQKTQKFTKHYLNIALDYGGRDEIVRAINKAQNTKHAFVPSLGRGETRNITEEDIDQNLDLASQPYPKPDIIIRTGKEYRLSGFMLWQSQYSELFFPDVYFPDFTPKYLETIIEEYAKRQRRFGK